MPKSGSRLVVKQRRPYFAVTAVVIIAAALGWAGWQVFDYGRLRAGFDSRETSARLERLRERVAALEKDNAVLRNRAAVAERGAMVDRQAYGDVEASLQRLQQENLELKREVAFYQGIVSPVEAAHGVRLKSLKLIQGKQSREYEYKLVLIQTAKVARLEKGYVSFIVQGMEDGLRREVSLERLSAGEASRHRFGFRYFQNFEGRIQLPDGFTPERVVVRIDTDSAKDAQVEKILDWVEVIV